ncbi:porin, OprB family [Paraburkholderia fungorum]|uniref:Porin, OprB family n=1 Tax=Paraburkholderia fungorum TaxID=134537 RepID=A0A1H1JZS7_9BURK|nr:carbohydrate porin [Paraburkholderia fungorum]SDR55513.1 porin, OprB family [Paraburkholderia fungorum]
MASTSISFTARRLTRHAILTAGTCGSLISMTSALAGPLDYLATSPYLLGSWNGQRERLADAGVTFEFTYTNEAAHNLSGGTDRLTRAAQQLAAGVSVDLDKLWGVRHTTFNFELTDRFGRSLDADANLGTSQQTQEIYGRGQTVWLTKMTLDRTFIDGRLLVSIGRDSEGQSFDVSDCNFQNLALCGPQASNLYGDYAMSWPGSVWMGRVKYDTTASTYVQAGVYQQSPTYYEASWERRNAWLPTGAGGTDGAVLPVEFGFTPTLNGLKGTYKLGFMYNTGGQPDLVRDVNGNLRALTGLPAGQSSSSYNAYIAVAQQLTGKDGGEGLTVNLRGVWGDRATSALDRQMSLGFEYKEPFHRAGDRIGVGMAATHSSSRAADYQATYNALHPADASAVGRGYETTYELFYSWRVVPTVSLQPDLQYIVHPGGTSQNANAFVVGLKSTVYF